MIENYNRTSHLEKNVFRPGSLEARLNEGEIIPTTKEEEIITQKKKINNKTRQIETVVKRKVLLEDGKIIADSGPKVSTRTKELNEKNDSEDEDKQYQTKRSTFKDKKLYDQLKNSDEYIELPHADQIVSEHIHKNNIIRECKQENYRFYDEKLKEIDAYDIHRKAIVSPHDLLKINSHDTFSDDDIPHNQLQNNKFELSKRNRGKLTHYSSKGYKIIDNDEEREIEQYDENNRLIKKKYRKHNHEIINDDELPENMFDNNKYIEQLKDVAGTDFVKISPKDYEFKPKSSLRQKSSSLTNLKYIIDREEDLIQDENRQKQRTLRSPLKQDEGKTLRYSDRSMSRQSLIINRNLEKKLNITESETYSTNTENWVGNHFVNEEEKPAAVKPRKHRSRNKEEKMLHQRSSSYSRVTKEDAAVQASFTSDESSDEETLTRKPLKTFYFGEQDFNEINEIRKFKNNNTSKSQFKSSLKTTYSEPEIPYAYKNSLNNKFNNMQISNKEYIHPIRMENDSNNNVLYTTKTTKYEHKTQAYEPSWNKLDARNYNPDFSSPYIPGVPPPKTKRSDRSIPLRSSLGKKDKTFNYTSTSYRTNLRSSGNEVKTNWPEFSPLNSPSEIVSTLRRNRSTQRDEFY